MKKIDKNRIGFTLVEVVLVITIIVILAGVLFINVKEYLDFSKNKTREVEASQESVSLNNKQMDEKLAGYGF